MLTPKLEELILKGRAFFKTFVAGGTKHTLSFGDDRFIIITDITYFPMNIPDKKGTENYNTQVAIYGERGYNHFIFRNYNAVQQPEDKTKNFCSPITINTYLMHTKQVGFSFVNAPFFNNINLGPASEDNPAYKPPLEYGKNGDIGVVDVILTMNAFNGPVVQNNFTIRPAPTNTESQQLFFPFSNDGSFKDSMNEQFEYPLLHVNYVEILGLPNNLSI